MEGLKNLIFSHKKVRIEMSRIMESKNAAPGTDAGGREILLAMGPYQFPYFIPLVEGTVTMSLQVISKCQLRVSMNNNSRQALLSYGDRVWERKLDGMYIYLCSAAPWEPEAIDIISCPIPLSTSLVLVQITFKKLSSCDWMISINREGTGTQHFIGASIDLGAAWVHVADTDQKTIDDVLADLAPVAPANMDS
jgi:hypothetical protein